MKKKIAIAFALLAALLWAFAEADHPDSTATATWSDDGSTITLTTGTYYNERIEATAAFCTAKFPDLAADDQNVTAAWAICDPPPAPAPSEADDNDEE